MIRNIGAMLLEVKNTGRLEDRGFKTAGILGTFRKVNMVKTVIYDQLTALAEKVTFFLSSKTGKRQGPNWATKPRACCCWVLRNFRKQDESPRSQ